jgi:hypothetical protein
MVPPVKGKYPDPPPDPPFEEISDNNLVPPPPNNTYSSDDPVFLKDLAVISVKCFSADRITAVELLQ